MLQGFALCVLRLLMASAGAGVGARLLVVQLGGIETTLVALKEHGEEESVQGGEDTDGSMMIEIDKCAY